jgi:hypothetical protein
MGRVGGRDDGEGRAAIGHAEIVPETVPEPSVDATVPGLVFRTGLMACRRVLLVRPGNDRYRDGETRRSSPWEWCIEDLRVDVV